MATTRTTADSAGRSSVLLRIAPELVGLVIAVALLLSTVGMSTTAAGPGPAFYPRVLGGLLVIALLVRIGQQLHSDRREAAGIAPESSGGEPSDFDPALISDRRVWVAVAFTVAYIVGTLYLGWPIATFVFVVAFLLGVRQAQPDGDGAGRARALGGVHRHLRQGRLHVPAHGCGGLRLPHGGDLRAARHLLTVAGPIRVPSSTMP